MIMNSVIGGTKLPVLANPAGAAQILSGYQAISSTSELIEGTVPVLAAQTITPGVAAKTIAAGQYLGGVQTIAGDTDLVPGNIRSGVNIFEVNGSLEGMEQVVGDMTLTYTGSSGAGSSFIYSDGTRSYKIDSQTGPISVLKNSIVFILISYENFAPQVSISGGISRVFSEYVSAGARVYGYFVTGDFTFTLENRFPT